VQISLRFEPGAYDGFYGIGSPVRIGAVTGPSDEVKQSGALLPVIYTEGAGFVPDGVGRWYLDISPTRLGDWRVTTICTGPAPQSRLRRFVVADTPDSRLPPWSSPPTSARSSASVAACSPASGPPREWLHPPRRYRP
jgi:hypothetical protein